MFKNTMILILFVYWCKTARSYEKLQFWEQEPNFRKLNNLRYRNNPSNDNQLLHHKNTINKENNRTHKEQSSSPRDSHHDSKKHQSNHDFSHKKQFVRSRDKMRNDTSKQGNMLRSRNRLRERSSGYSLAQSTRLTPIYLMQQPPEEQENKTEQPVINEEVPEMEELSPYGLAEQMNKILSKFPHANVTTEILGRTAEYNDILLLKISELKDAGKGDATFRAEENKYMDEIPEKKIIFIVHGLSVMGIGKLLCLSEKKYFSKLLSYYLDHLHQFDIFLIPMANPDGYAYLRSYKDDAFFWNKNFSPQESCPGVSLDRNFDVAWNTSKVISSCSQLYPGPTPFSEPETRAVRDVFHHYSHKIIAYFHVHSGVHNYDVFKGDAVLYPKGFTDVQSDDDKYIDIRAEIDEAMKNASFQVVSVTVDTLYNWYSKVTGTSVDYASTIYGIPYAMELVMQLYDNSPPQKLDLSPTSEPLGNDALTEIWKRVIDVIFNNIWKNTNDAIQLK